MIATEVRSHPAIRKRDLVLPDQGGGGQETFTPLGRETRYLHAKRYVLEGARVVVARCHHVRRE